MADFDKSFDRVSSKKVAELERRLGVDLPADYCQFLLTTNGGIPAPNCFQVPDRDSALVDYLYGIRSERTYCDLEWEQEQATLWEALPPGFVAIGHDPGGSTLLLATLGEDAGRVFFLGSRGIVGP